MEFIILYFLIICISIISILFVNTKSKGIITLSTVITLGLISSFISVKVLLGNNFELLLSGTSQLGMCPLKIDYLSAWFILTINFTLTTGAIYGINYMQQYIEQKNNITMHCIALHTFYYIVR